MIYLCVCTADCVEKEKCVRVMVQERKASHYSIMPLCVCKIIRESRGKSDKAQKIKKRNAQHYYTLRTDKHSHLLCMAFVFPFYILCAFLSLFVFIQKVTEINTISICYQHHSIWTILLFLLLLCSTLFSTDHIFPRFTGVHPLLRFSFHSFFFFSRNFHQAFLCASFIWDCMNQMENITLFAIQEKSGALLFFWPWLFVFFASAIYFCMRSMFSKFCEPLFDQYILKSSAISNLFFPLWKMRTNRVYTHINKAINYYILYSIRSFFYYYWF